MCGGSRGFAAFTLVSRRKALEVKPADGGRPKNSRSCGRQASIMCRSCQLCLCVASAHHHGELSLKDLRPHTVWYFSAANLYRMESI